MHVAHLIDSLHWGGAEKWIVSFTEVARLRGLDVTVMSLQPFLDGNPYRDQLELLGANVKAFSISRLYDFVAMPTLMQTLRTGQFDIIQTHLTQANILGTLEGMRLGIPVVATLHSTNSGKLGHYRSRSWAEQIVLKYGASRIIAVGTGVAEAHRKRFGDKVIDIVHNGVKPGVVLSASERKALRIALVGDTNQTLIIAVGRLVPLKGYTDLLLAFSQARKKHPGLHLLIVGDGIMRRDLEEQTITLGVKENVHFLGARTDVPKLLAASDVFVNSSYWEGLSIAMLEAMAAGLPILATSVGEAPFLLAAGRGLLVQPHNTDALTQGLDKLLDPLMARQEMGVAARAFVESNYSLEPWLDKILEVYTKAQDMRLSRKVSLA